MSIFEQSNVYINAFYCISYEYQKILVKKIKSLFDLESKGFYWIKIVYSNAVTIENIFVNKQQTFICKDTNIKIRKTKFIYTCGSKKGSSSSTVNTGEVWGNVSRT